jgi:hypothetical protein
MNTAVQLRSAKDDASAAPRCELLHGSPRAFAQGRSGPIAVFGAGELVAYLVRVRRRHQLFVFRTLEADDSLAARVPGVRPHVRLLLNVASAGRTRLVRSLFAYLVAERRDPSALSDAFWFRVSVALAGRLPPHKLLVSLLSHDSVQP